MREINLPKKDVYMKTLLFGLALLIGRSALATPHVFVTNEMGDSVTVIDATTNQVSATINIGKRPRGIGISPDGSEIYVAVSGDSVIAVIDPVEHYIFESQILARARRISAARFDQLSERGVFRDGTADVEQAEGRAEV